MLASSAAATAALAAPASVPERGRIVVAPPLPPVVRESAADRANAVFNHPAVRPWVLLPGQEAIDLSGFVADPRNYLLMDGEGSVAIAFHFHEVGVFEAHTCALPEARGATTLAAVKSMLAFMFIVSGAMEIVTRCPAHNPAAEKLARLIGGSMEFERAAAWPTDQGLVAIRYYRLDYAAWARTAEILPALGEWFHQRLEAENARLGIPDELHEGDSSHDRAVGSAVAMILAGQPAKGVILYNRWARLAGYGLANIVSATPLIIDIGTHLLRVHETGFEVLRPGAVQ